MIRKQENVKIFFSKFILFSYVCQKDSNTDFIIISWAYLIDFIILLWYVQQQ